MYLIRRFEEGAEDSNTRGLIHGTMPLLIAQEASAMATCMELTEQDKITSTHRGHGQCIAKGADVGRMFAEFFMPVEVILPKVDMDMSHGTLSTCRVAEGDFFLGLVREGLGPHPPPGSH